MGNTILFVVDASGSMGANQRMIATKGAILSLLIDAYQKRDKVGLVAFKNNRAELLLPPTSSVEMAESRLQELPTGGKTPLSAGLSKGYEVLMQERARDANSYPLLVLLTDGKANVGLANNKPPLEEVKEIAGRIKLSRMGAMVIDTEAGFISFGLAKEVAEAMGANYLKLEELRADKIAGSIKEILSG